MSKHVSETNEKPSPRRVGDAAAYSARVQETMRYNRLRSSEYSLVMTIMNAILRGNSEEAWKEEQQRTVEALTKQTPDQGTTHTDAANRYEQTVDNLKDLKLWPW
jgi:hypothetical protein